MFNARNLVVLSFLLWSGICWSWYVCVIKDVCWSIERTADTDAPEAETLPSEAPTETYTPPVVGNVSVDAADLSKVQVTEGDNLLVVHFPYNSAQKEADAAVDAYLSRLARQAVGSDKTIVVSGHTDFVGDEATNRAISQKRAESVRALLVAKGVPAARVVCRAYGEQHPLATNDTPEGRYLNRRVEIVLGE